MNRNTIIPAVVAALVFGATAGGAIVYEMVPTREPESCRIAREATDDYLIAQSNLLSAERERAGAPDWFSREVANDKVNLYLDQLKPLAATYQPAFDACEAATS